MTPLIDSRPQMARRVITTGNSAPLSWRVTARACRVAAAIIPVLGLLAAFHAVVSRSLEQGESRRRMTALAVEVAWRCKDPAERDRDFCSLKTGTSLPAATDLESTRVANAAPNLAR